MRSQFERCCIGASTPSALRTHWRAIVCCDARNRARAGASTARADDDLPDASAASPISSPGNSTCRLGLSNDWTAIGINYPITSGDTSGFRATVAPRSITAAVSSASPATRNLNVARLDDRQLSYSSRRGLLIVRVRVLDTDDAARIDTPNRRSR